MGKFSNAIGIWDFKIGNEELELKPTMGDVKLFRNILLNDTNRKEKMLLYDKFSDFMYGMIKKQYAEESDVEVREWVEININSLFEEATVAFKWTDKEQLNKSKKEVVDELKKSMSSV
jgi:hypothetical protein